MEIHQNSIMTYIIHLLIQTKYILINTLLSTTIKSISLGIFLNLITPVELLYGIIEPASNAKNALSVNVLLIVFHPLGNGYPFSKDIHWAFLGT
jgi:hypothetical protein